MTLLQALQRLLISLDSRFQLTDILGTTFPKGRLGLTITLFPFLRSGVDLKDMTGLINGGDKKRDRADAWPRTSQR